MSVVGAGVHFLGVIEDSQEGGYEVEKETAFLPAWPVALHLLASALQYSPCNCHS